MKLPLDAWTEHTPMPLPRAGCSVGVIKNRLWVAGGTYWKDGVKYWSDQVDSLDPATDRWETGPRFPELRGDAASVVADDALYIFGGGADGPAKRSVFMWLDGKWNSDPELSLPEARRSSAVVRLNSTFYLFGGLSGNGTQFDTATSSVWAAPRAGPWRRCAEMPGPPRFNTAAGIVGNLIVIAGGCTPIGKGVQNLDTVLVYDPVKDAWSEGPRLPFAFRGASGLSGPSGLTIFGGYTDKFLSCIQHLNLNTGAVSVVGALPYAIADTRFVRIASEVWGVTGEDGIQRRFPRTLRAAAET